MPCDSLYESAGRVMRLAPLAIGGAKIEPNTVGLSLRFGTRTLQRRLELRAALG
jgi:hypothetical protein